MRPARRPPTRTRSRLEHDRDLVAARHPGLAFSCELSTKQLELRGTVTLVEEETGVQTSIHLRFGFPRTYPNEEPKVYEVGGRFPRVAARHINPDPDGSFCLWLKPLSRWDPSSQDALAVFLDRVSVFCEDQLTFEAIGHWPRAEWAHYDAGYAEFLFEALGHDSAFLDVLATAVDPGRIAGRNDPCPCGRGKKFKHCHAEVLAQACRRIGAEGLRRGVAAWQQGDRGNVSCSSGTIGRPIGVQVRDTVSLERATSNEPV